eukprot:9875436-Ditylum_brightwellii.AAC.1
MACDYRPLKQEKYRVRLTIGGDELVYDDETASPAASILETKIIVNSTIPDASKSAHFMGIDIMDFSLQTPLPPGKQEYMKMDMYTVRYEKEYMDLNKQQSLHTSNLLKD